MVALLLFPDDLRLAFIDLWFGTGLQSFPVPDESLAAVLGHLKVLSEFQGVSRTGILAKAAEHAPAQVVGELSKFLAASHGIALAPHNDQVLGAHHSTQIASDAQ